ncbi:MAG TPA: hypothetical protein VHW69_16685 [Rhizomicrobium sp.]|jgi:hypothetical protein|nr:hypothetical protein [Rhizomicrobium sp.]
MATAAHETHELFMAPFRTLTERNRAILEKTLRTAHEETLEFFNRRLERNTRTLERLRHCDGLSGLLAIDHEWFSDAVRDSFEQTQRMTNLWWRLTEEELDAQAEAAENAKDVVRTQTPASGRKEPLEQRTSQERAAA